MVKVRGLYSRLMRSPGTSTTLPGSSVSISSQPCPLAVAPADDIDQRLGLAAGLTPVALEQRIASDLKAKSLEPQVVVEITANLSNTVFVSGDVRNPNRYPLTLQHEHLLDILALAGGAAHPPAETLVDVVRGRDSQRARLDEIDTLDPRNVVLVPGDRISLEYNPRTFTVFGASGRVKELPFETASVTLAQGLAQAAGLNDDQSDPTAVYLFRYERPEAARQLGLPGDGQPVPVIYRVNLMDPTGYFMMEKFALRDVDLVYAANARSMKLKKFLGLVASLFQPAAVTKNIAQ